MNWGGWNMKSGRLYFNRAIARDFLRRCWPLWVSYLIFLILTFPLMLESEIHIGGTMRQTADSYMNLCRQHILQAGIVQAHAAVVTAILAVMVLFGYLYNTRGNTLMNCLPIRRESLFLTLYLTGMVPMLLSQVLVMGITMLLTLPYGIEVSFFLQWLTCAALGLIAFFGFAVFCAMLTGNILILPAVYAVLNFTAVGFETCIRSCLSSVVYGMTYGKLRFSFLSPIAKIIDALNTVSERSGVRLEGLNVLAAYAAVGLIFALFAMLLYRNRRMESVSDFVAIPILKPIFRWCMGLGGAFLFAALVFENFFEWAVSGTKAAWLMVGLLLIGACLGWIVAEMMIRRTVRVFPLPWKGLCMVCLICVLTILTAETDITGYERRVPDPSKVAQVQFCYDTVFTQPENIDAVTRLHHRLITDKERYDVQQPVYEEMYSHRITEAWGADQEEAASFWVPITYVMENGRVQQRLYLIRYRSEEVDQPDSVIGEILAVLNSGEGIKSRMNTDVPMEEQYVNYAVINREMSDGLENAYRLSPSETVELWNLAMLPDAEEGNLSLYTISDTEENLKKQTNLRIEINLFDQDQLLEPYYWYHSYRVFTFSEHCLEWIEKNTGLQWDTMNKISEQRNEKDGQMNQ